MPAVLGTVAAWVGRALALAFAGWAVVHGSQALSYRGLDVATLFLGVAVAGGVLATFGRTRRLGWTVGLAGLWASMTWYGVTAVTDPVAVIINSAGGRRSIGTSLGAYTRGGFFLVLANVPLLVWAWLRLTAGRRRRDVPPPAPPLTPRQRRRQRKRRR
ncbi:hypothetical protein [Nocardioides sp.]|uniref:hypothetical protein n=1 Tax=Nocardioides sp. TaxID=35761 RepID=UPI002718510D|nr:hypothetical protein [Nocardioides sp.]MDO9457402.1 hypothetical protein [Nocardioides sp.]